MSKFIPSGYISIHEALNQIGRELFSSNWTGEERRARRGLISPERWLKIKDLPPASGVGAGGGFARPITARVPDDPSSLGLKLGCAIGGPLNVDS
jgi:hypothetical protein